MGNYYLVILYTNPILLPINYGFQGNCWGINTKLLYYYNFIFTLSMEPYTYQVLNNYEIIYN